MVDRKIAGYTVLEHSFFSRGFIAMLLVHPYRRVSVAGDAPYGHLIAVKASLEPSPLVLPMV